MSVPSDWSFVEIYEDLLGFQIFFQAPGTEFAAEAGLFVAAPGRFDVRGLHVIDPHDSSTQRFNDAKRSVNIARPHGSSEAVRSVVGDADRVGFAVKRNHRSDRAEDFFAGDARVVVDIVENRGFDVVALAEFFRPAAADGHLGLFLADLKVRTDAVVLLLADQRPHLGFSLKRRAELDAFRFLGHGLDKLRVNLFLDKNAATSGANFTLIDEDAEQSPVDGSLPIRFGEENIGRLAAELQRDPLQSIRSAFYNDFSHGGAAGKRDLVDTRMRNQRSSGSLAKTVDDVDHPGREAHLVKPIRKFQRSERSLL